MSEAEWFAELRDDFEESVRIDRAEQETEERSHRARAIESYHLTVDAEQFLRDFVNRTLGQAEDMRSGANYWIYGYYGSGKSHLLTVLDGLLDTGWVDEHPDVWSDLIDGAGRNGLDDLSRHWRTVHDEYQIIPISVNLLKHQGRSQQSFSEIILSRAHESAELTGVDDTISTGLSSQSEVAYFEKWLQTTPIWPKRDERARALLRETLSDQSTVSWKSDNIWADIQRYGVLADVVLPTLFEEVNGTRDGYTDLQPSEVGPGEVIEQLEELRSAREAESEKPVKLVLLLDEVSLFIGTDFQLLTELQTIAEKVDETGGGDIQLVATAQAKVSDTQPRFAAHGADYSILKDRFPHRDQLPSKHVGEIAKRRLFAKSEAGRSAVHRLLDNASIAPADSLVYADVSQNTDPPLDSIGSQDELIAFYPFLPYQPSLFLEILFNLREKASDPAKSIFSGTARAILALVHSLLQDWVTTDNPDQIVSLVDFYKKIQPELYDILEHDMRSVEGPDDDGVSTATDEEPELARSIAGEVENDELEPFDLDVARAVLLLRQIHELVPLTEGNIAVAVMSELNGRSWTRTQTRVENSLDRLQKFVRPTEDETGPRYRFATQEERRIYHEAEAKEHDPDWVAILEALGEHLWGDVVQDLSLPDSVPYGSGGTAYPVDYDFGVDGVQFETTTDTTGRLSVSIRVEGLRPEHSPDRDDKTTLYWTIESDGMADLRTRLIEWWALRDSIATRNTPPAVQRELSRRKETVRGKVLSAVRGGSYTVKDRPNITGLQQAVTTTVDVTYPDDFHPEMIQVGDDRLQELVNLEQDDPLPEWARRIQVPGPDQSPDESQTIQRNVLSLAGRQLKDSEDSLNVTTVLDGIASEKPFYDNVRPSIYAILWGFCREGRLVAVDESGETRPESAILDSTRRSTTRLKLLPRRPIGDWLEEGGFKQTTETVAEGLIHFREANEQLRASFIGLAEDVRLVADTDIRSDAVDDLLESFANELTARAESATSRLETVKTQSDGLEDAIDATRDAQAWREDVSDIWPRRLDSIYRFDAHLSLRERHFDWVTNDTRAEIDEQQDALVQYDDSWWTKDGWDLLVSATVAGLGVSLQESWRQYTESCGLSSLAHRIDEHPWVVSAMDRPPGLLHNFEAMYITPLYAIQRWYRTLSDALESLTADDEDELLSAIETFSTIDPFAEVADLSVSEVETRLERLSTMADTRSPEDVDKIGVLPGDRDKIDTRVANLVEDEDFDVEVTDSGVFIR